MSSSISIYAGKIALQQIKQHGLSGEQVSVMAGASGGPKWFTLFGLDKYLFGEFFAQRKSTLHTIGSSAGAWRLACLAQKDPVAAIERLAHFYSNEQYSAKPTASEITQKADDLLSKVLGETGSLEIAENQLIQSHFIVARAKGLNVSENKYKQLLGLFSAASGNFLSKNNLDLFFQRFVFYNQASSSTHSDCYFDFKHSKTQYIPLKSENVHKVLMATGAIPLVLNGVTDIPGAPQGTYRDGGIIDYHLDINFGTQGLVLYPHFFPSIKPGWFDKKLSYRNADPKNFDRVVMITPSPQHVANLPYGKISDRSDFTRFDTNSRIKYWQTVLSESHKMADDFSNLVDNNTGIDKINPIESIL